MTTPARAIVDALKGRWYSDYGAVKCPAHEDHSPSLRIRDGETGAPLVTCYAGCERVAVIAALRQLGIWPERDGERRETRRPRLRRQYAKSASTTPAAPRTLSSAEVERVEFAKSIWEATQHAEGSIVERYWREARGISLPIPTVLRFAHAVPYGYPKADKPPPQKYPAMVAMVQSLDGAFAGVHCTFLMADGRDKNRRLERLVFGAVGRCAVRLAEATDYLAIGEGIETTASYMQEMNVPGWAAMNTSGLRNVALPPVPVAIIVTLLGENDEERGPQRIIPSDQAIAVALPRMKAAWLR